MTRTATQVLHVDDEPQFRGAVKSALEREAAELDVVTETCAEDGLSRLRTDSIDCVVSDYDLPKTDGLDFLERVQESHPDVPFILFTGTGSEEIASAAISRGVTDYLRKGDGTEQYETLANRIQNSVEGRRTERAVSRNRAVLDRALALSPAAILVLDEDGRIVRANERAESVLDVPESELTTRTVDGPAWNVVDAEGNPADLFPVDRVRRTEAPVHNVERGVRRPEEGIAWLSITAAPLRNEPDDGVIAVLTDTTPMDREDQALRSAVRQLENFGSVLSHDLGNVLHVAQSRLELARNTDDADQLDAVDHSIDRARDVLDELTTAMQAGAVVNQVSAVEVGSVFDHAWASQSTANATRSVVDGVRIRADERALQRLFENVIRNAFEHGSDAPTLRVGTVENGFYVEDDGPGIPEDERDQVFEPGYTTKPDGTGTGLVSIRQIAIAHGWETSIAEGSDGGARFVFTNVDTPE